MRALCAVFLAAALSGFTYGPVSFTTDDVRSSQPEGRQEAADLPKPILNGGAGESLAREGYYTISWELPESTGLPSSDPSIEYQLFEEDSSGDLEAGVLSYEGPDLATTVSGIENGVYRYRVRVVDVASGQKGPWSDEYRVRVRHHPLSRAFGFLVLGAVVFLATLGVILVGNRMETRERSASLE